MPNNSYQLLKDTNEIVNRLESKIDKRLCEIEGRVDTLEDFRGRILGIGGIIAAVFGVVGAWIWDKITNKI
jgi:hypothetical protein